MVFVLQKLLFQNLNICQSYAFSCYLIKNRLFLKINSTPESMPSKLLS